MTGDVAVWNAFGHPYGATVHITSLLVKLGVLAYDFHNPDFIGVAKSERLSLRSISVLLHKLIDQQYSLTSRLTSLQSYVNERAVIQYSGSVDELASAVSGFTYYKLMLVHVSYHRVNVRGLRNSPQPLSAVPINDLTHRACRIIGSRTVMQGSVQLVGVGRICAHVRAVGRSPFGNYQVGAGKSTGSSEHCCNCKNQFLHYLLFIFQFPGHNPRSN